MNVTTKAPAAAKAKTKVISQATKDEVGKAMIGATPEELRAQAAQLGVTWQAVSAWRRVAEGKQATNFGASAKPTASPAVDLRAALKRAEHDLEDARADAGSLEAQLKTVKEELRQSRARAHELANRVQDPQGSADELADLRSHVERLEAERAEYRRTPAAAMTQLYLLCRAARRVTGELPPAWRHVLDYLVALDGRTWSEANCPDSTSCTSGATLHSASAVVTELRPSFATLRYGDGSELLLDYTEDMGAREWVDVLGESVTLEVRRCE